MNVKTVVLVTCVPLCGHVSSYNDLNYSPLRTYNAGVSSVCSPSANTLSCTLQDYDFVMGKSEYEDVLQCNNQPSSLTPRGHQFPAAFMIRASGMDKVSRGACACMCTVGIGMGKCLALDLVYNCSTSLVTCVQM